MKKNLGISFVIFIMLCFSSIGIAQSYTTAGGIRLGTEWGATLQQRILKRVTLEGILQQGIIKEEFVITGLVERHYPLISKRFNVYLGGGLHKGWTTNPEATYDNPWGLKGLQVQNFLSDDSIFRMMSNPLLISLVVTKKSIYTQDFQHAIFLSSKKYSMT